MFTPEEWHAKGRFFQFDQHSIFFIDSNEKDKPVLILLHGFPTSSWDWHLIYPTLSQHFRIIALDFIGYGFSDKPQHHDYSFYEQADIVQRLLESLEIKDFHILAHDYGDTVAQELIARDDKNHHILSTVLLNGGIIYEAIDFAMIQRLLLSPIGGLVARLMTYKSFQRNFDNICFIKRPESELKNYWQLINHNQGRKVVAKLIHYITERKNNRNRWVNSLQNSASPLIFIAGIEDPISGKVMLEHFKQLIPHQSSAALADVGHYPQAEAPQALLSLLLNFWSSQDFVTIDQSIPEIK